jgi:hypothetical protein
VSGRCGLEDYVLYLNSHLNTGEGGFSTICLVLRLTFWGFLILVLDYDLAFRVGLYSRSV